MKKIIVLMLVLIQLFVMIFPISFAEETEGNNWPMYSCNSSNTGFLNSVTSETNETFLELQLINKSGSVQGSIVDGKLFTGFDSGFYCFNAYSGSEIWNNDLGTTYQTPAVENGYTYIVDYDQGLMCFNLTTGEKIWTYDMSNIYTNPTVSDGKIYFGTGQNKKLYCINSDGTDLWNFTAPRYIYTTPAVFEDKVYFSASREYGGNSHIYCFNATDGNQIWMYEHYDVSSISPTIYDKKLYIGSDHSVFCLDTKGNPDGTTTLLWNITLPLGPKPTAIAAANNRVYFGHEYFIYCADADNGLILWKYETDGKTLTPSLSSEKLYVCSEKTVYCFDVDLSDDVDEGNDDGSVNYDILWTYTTAKKISSSPVIAEGRVWVFTYRHYIYGFGPNDAPETPNKPTGPTEGEAEEELTFITNEVTDFESHKILYLFDWGDGTDSGWVELASANHIWSKQGIYEIKVKAKDSYDAESDWSESLTVIIAPPKPKLEIITNSTVIEESDFTVTIEEEDTEDRVEGAIVTFNEETKQTDSNGQCVITAPNVDTSTEYILTASLWQH